LGVLAGFVEGLADGFALALGAADEPGAALRSSGWAAVGRISRDSSGQ
jgi:hypothetical protein